MLATKKEMVAEEGEMVVAAEEEMVVAQETVSNSKAKFLETSFF